MHKSLLKAVVGKAFFAVDTAVDLIRYAYGVIDKSGGLVLDEVEAAVKKLHEVLDKAIDEIPG